MDKQCKCCGDVKDIASFPRKISRGIQYFGSNCRSCETEKRKTRARNMDYIERHQKKAAEKRKMMRKNGLEQSRWILYDTRGSDKKKNLENDLTREFIEEKIRNGCEYCGETSLRMTLDRKDNSKGHTKDNVNASCIRCNYMRRDMPYEAWLALIDKIREINILGLFGDWFSYAFSRENST